MSATLNLASEDRFARFHAIEWWDQQRLDKARVLVVGAGALGNEVIKNFALLGLGQLAVVDRDLIERSNLTRSVLFRETDIGKSKAECAARAAQDIYSGTRVFPLVGNILADFGLGHFRWAQVVVGALDSRETRVFVNSACARVGRPWIDGGIEAMQGIARGFAPPQTACYECTMSQVDWELINQRRSCSLLARRALAQRGTPTTPITASVIGAIQAQEVVKLLHGHQALTGRGYLFEGSGHNSYNTTYRIHPDCPWHTSPAEVVGKEEFSQATPLREVWQWAEAQLSGLEALDLARELVQELECSGCKTRRPVFKSVEQITEEEARCPACAGECVPHFIHCLGKESPLLDRTARQLGLPPWDIVWARQGENVLGIEFSGDRPEWAVTDIDNP
jgi:molybdopterin/thiamine biosynthesis adenylyltransferase